MSFAVFASKLLRSALGVVATLYFAREIGAAVLDSYALVLALVAWLKLGGRLGASSVMTKRMSEEREPAAYVTAAGVVVCAAETPLETAVGLDHNFATVLVLVAFGAAVYFSTLVVLSSTHPATVRKNSPIG